MPPVTCELTQVLPVKPPPLRLPAWTRRWRQFCSSSDMWPVRGMNYVNVWPCLLPEPPLMTAGTVWPLHLFLKQTSMQTRSDPVYTCVNRGILPGSAVRCKKHCKTMGKQSTLIFLFPCVSVSTSLCDVYLTLASLVSPCVTLNLYFICLFVCEIDQTRKQVMTMSVWSCSAWRLWQTYNPCKTSTAALWRGVRRLWRKQTSTSEWKNLPQGIFVNFLTACTFLLFAVALRLQGFSCCSVCPLTYSQQISSNRFYFCESNRDESFIPIRKLMS